MSQQASALSTLVGAAPDQLNDTYKEVAAEHCRTLLQFVSPTDTAAMSSILSTLSSLTSQAAADATTAVLSRRLGAEYSRHLLATAATAQSLLGQTNAAVNDIMNVALASATVGQRPVTLQV